MTARTPRRTTFRWLVAVGCSVSCGPSRTPAPPVEHPPPPRETVASTETFTHSPRPEAHASGRNYRCGQPDAGLRQVAETVLGTYRETGALVAADELTFLLRSVGLPYVRVRSWAARAGDSPRLHAQLETWAAATSPSGVRRCGVAWSESAAGSQGVALVADVLADVAPFPRRAHVGQWVPFEAQLIDAWWANNDGEVSLVALGPRGLPYGVPVHVKGSNGVLGRFSVTSPGRWLLQLLATTPSGPLPVAELEVFADAPLPESPAFEPALGEYERTPPHATDSETLRDLVNRARVAEKVLPLETEPTLERLAETHAAAMLTARRLAHDLGDGDAYIRVSPHLPSLTFVGENLAHAQSVTDAHRSLWRSPSHRLNLLRRDFTHIGVGVAHGAAGDVWVCQLFAADEGPSAPHGDWPGD